jgi:hypothetical protein
VAQKLLLSSGKALVDLFGFLRSKQWAISLSNVTTFHPRTWPKRTKQKRFLNQAPWRNLEHVSAPPRSAWRFSVGKWYGEWGGGQGGGETGREKRQLAKSEVRGPLEADRGASSSANGKRRLFADNGPSDASFGLFRGT